MNLKGFEYLMELKYGITSNLKAKDFSLSITAEVQKWFNTLEPRSPTLYAKLRTLFKTHFKCNIQKSLTLIDLISCKQGATERLEKFVPCFQKVWRVDGFISKKYISYFL